jgi:3-hydroxyisobutyrate dehydrogenase-like beta-hydroxyacid dehydrogenase
MSANETIGFIGLGVMGGPMCRNMATKHPGQVLAFDLNPAAVKALEDTPARRVESIAQIAHEADIIFLSLPGDAQVGAVCGDGGPILEHARAGACVVDLSTTSVPLAQKIGSLLQARGISFADAPVARTREAAQRGELSIMVGTSEAVFARIKPLLDHIGSDVTHCGDVGTGQVVKLINNALVFEHVAALAEMMVVGERAGVAPRTLLEAVSKGSGDSFVLRNHGMKAMLPRTFPDKAFPPEYVLKDLGYVLSLAQGHDVATRITEVTKAYYQAACEQGLGGRYFPGVIEVIEKGGLGSLHSS